MRQLKLFPKERRISYRYKKYLPKAVRRRVKRQFADMAMLITSNPN